MIKTFLKFWFFKKNRSNNAASLAIELLTYMNKTDLRNITDFYIEYVKLIESLPVMEKK